MPLIAEVEERSDEAHKSHGPSGRPTCRHCGAPSPQGDFCCPGCAYVHRLIHESGFDAYYHIRDDVVAPADVALQPERDTAWLAIAQREAEAAAPEGRTPSLELSIQGISCAGCVWLIERVFQREPGAGRIEINAQTGSLRLRWRAGAFAAAAFARTLQRFNYLVGPARSAADMPAESRALTRRIGLCAAFAMNVMLFALPAYFGMTEDFAYARLFATLAMVFATLSLLAGGGFFLSRALRSLREGALHIDLPIALGIVGSYVGSMYGWLTAREEYMYFDFVSGFILLMLVGRWAQVAAVERNQRRLLRLQPAPPAVRVIGDDGAARSVPPVLLQPGWRFEVGAGQGVPVDARLESPEAVLSLAWINGEADPRTFRCGQPLPAGAQNAGRSPLVAVATRPWAQSLLAELLKPVERPGHRHGLIERVIQIYLFAIITTAIISGAAWWWATGDALHAGAIVTAVLVVSCPCALGLACPLADEMATVALRRRGVFVRAADLWPRLAQLRRLVFDKTGTLTLETPVLREPGAVSALTPDARAALLALVQDSPHPVSRSLHEQVLMLGPVEPLRGEIVETIGAGVALAGGGWTLGRAGWRDDGPADGATVLARDGRAVARFTFAEAARADAREELAALGRRGLATTILSGDHPDKVAALARGLGLPEASALGGLSPRDKADWIEAHVADATLMLGDGANDSLAFDRALCRGTPVVHRGVLEEKADFYYLGRGIDGIRALLEINDRRRATHVALLVFMVAYNLAAVGLAVAGFMHPLLAAVLMPLSSLATLAIVGLGLRPAFRRAGD